MIELARKQRYKTIAITNLGAILEWFEFSLYGYLATYMSILFFPKEDSIPIATNTPLGLMLTPNS